VTFLMQPHSTSSREVKALESSRDYGIIYANPEIVNAAMVYLLHKTKNKKQYLFHNMNHTHTHNKASS
jgi:hypothetical protein